MKIDTQELYRTCLHFYPYICCTQLNHTKSKTFSLSARKRMQFVFCLQHVSTSLNFRECAVSADRTCHLKCTCNTTRVILKEVMDQQVGTPRKDLFVVWTELGQQRKWVVGISIRHKTDLTSHQSTSASKSLETWEDRARSQHFLHYFIFSPYFL